MKNYCLETVISPVIFFRPRDFSHPKTELTFPWVTIHEHLKIAFSVARDPKHFQWESINCYSPIDDPSKNRRILTETTIDLSNFPT